MAFTLSQCTWAPAYDDRGSMDGSLSVKSSDPVFACRLKNDLLQRMKAMKVSDRTVVRVDVALSQGDLAYHPSHYAMRSQVKAQVNLRVDRPDRPTYTQTFSEVTSFMLDQNEGWLNTQARDHANERLLARLADLLMQELVNLTVANSPDLDVANPRKPS